MKEIIALQEYTDKYVSLYQGQIRNIEDILANKLIEKGIIAEHSDSSGGGITILEEQLLVSFSINASVKKTLSCDFTNKKIPYNKVVSCMVDDPGQNLLLSSYHINSDSEGYVSTVSIYVYNLFAQATGGAFPVKIKYIA